jgi:hypothetical protein
VSWELQAALAAASLLGGGGGGGGGGASPGGGFLSGLAGALPAIFGGPKTQVTTTTNTSLGVAANPIVAISVGGGTVSPSSGGSAAPVIDATSNPSQGGDSFGLPNFYSPQPSMAAKFPGISDYPLSGNATTGGPDFTGLLLIGGAVLALAMFAGKKGKG